MVHGASGLWKTLAYPLSMYGVTQEWYVRINAGLDGLLNGKLEQILNDAGSGRPVLEVVPYSLAALLLIEGVARYLRGPRTHQAPQRAVIPQSPHQG